MQGNTIQNNQGLAVQLTGSGADTVVDNTIAGNAGGQGVGLYLQGDSQTTIQGNDIISNTASGGSAERHLPQREQHRPRSQDNTVADNTAAGSGIADGPTVMDVWGFPAMEQNNFADPTATYEIADGNASGTADLDATPTAGGIPPTPPSSPPISTTSRSTSTRASLTTPPEGAPVAGAPAPPPISGGGEQRHTHTVAHARLLNVQHHSGRRHQPEYRVDHDLQPVSCHRQPAGAAGRHTDD